MHFHAGPLPPFSDAGISEWHLMFESLQAGRFFTPPFSDAGISEWHTIQEETTQQKGPPFSDAGISEWHRLARR